MSGIITCPHCAAHWTGLKIEHCTVCHATFTSTRAGDRHLVDRDPVTGRPRHLTIEEMAALRRRGSGELYYQSKTNPYGTVLWGEYNPQPHPRARARDVDGLTAAPVGDGVP